MASEIKRVKKLLSYADVEINGDRPWDIQVHDKRLFSRVFASGSLGLGEAYMDGWWDSPALDKFFDRVLTAKLEKRVIRFGVVWNVVKAKIRNRQRRKKAHEIGKAHYDKGNDLYKAMLDKRMNYSCGYWKKAKILDKAQEAKLELICKKIGLKKGMSVLDIGCGWGGFAKYAAEKYGVKVLGITVSKEQFKLANELCKNLPVEIRLQDYRSLKGTFDRIVSVGMIEHVGYKNYKSFMKVASRCLKNDGLFLLHTIGNKKSRIMGDRWMDKYIFPRGMLPSIKQLSKAAEGLFVIEDLHNFGADYDRTLMEWHANFNENWDELKHNYDKGDDGERFKRMWNYYLLSCAGSFRSRRNQLWQIVLSKDGVRGGYKSIR
ncbi:cyclopropane fatty acyl phospholipid synthase [Bacteroidota bacterium]